MKYLQNLHQHTLFCDGDDSPEDIVLAAINKNFTSIGFSGHSYMSKGESDIIIIGNTKQYKACVEQLKEKYKDKIEIFCGLEQEMYSNSYLSDYDYIIGSSHCLKLDGNYIEFDIDAEMVKNIIEKYFDCDGMLYAKEYYKQISALPEFGKFDIIGHFDLITKYCEKENFFDTDTKEYRNAAVEAIEALAGKIPYFEVNTGAIARGYRTTPYPMKFLIKEFKRLGFGAVITSDCHDKNYIDFGFNEAEELLKECGFREKFILTADGFIPTGF